MNVTYLRYELLRLSRNKRFFFFSLAFPLALFADDWPQYRGPERTGVSKEKNFLLPSPEG